MKKILLTMLLAAVTFTLCNNAAEAEQTSIPEPVIKIEIPASEVDKIDIKYESKEESATSKAMDGTKEAAKKAVDSTREFTEKTVTTTKSAAKKSAENTKSAADKAVEATKGAANKAVNATKNAAKKTAENTKDVVDNINPNKPVTEKGLKAEANIKTLKNEKNELKSAYNSRIKDVDAKIKATEKYTDLTDTQKKERIYKLNKEKALLEKEKTEYIEKYDKKIETAQEQKRKNR